MPLTRRDVSLTVALCASLTLHTLLLRGAADLYTKEIGSRIFLPGIERQQIANQLLIQPEDDPEHRLGDSTGHGDSISASPGETPLQASKGPQNQPFLSLDPAGAGHVNDEPSDSVLPPAQAAAAAQPAAQSPPPSEPETPFGVKAPEEFSPYTAPSSSAAPSPQAAATPTATQPPGDPAPQGDSEIDPIKTVGSVEFRHGSASVRLGRNHKLIRPRLSLAAQADLLTLASPIVVLKLKLDETGNVISATIFRSSGSASVDEVVKVAAYKWWFEPSKDSTGKPIKDVILFTVGFIG